MEINQQAIVEILENRELDFLPPEARSLMIGLFSDGLQGLLDAAVLNNIDKLPASLRDIVAPYLLEVQWDQVPEQISQMFNSFFREGGTGLTSTIGNIIGDIGNFDFDNFINGVSAGGVQGILSSISNGTLGGVSQILSDFGGIDLLSIVPGSGIIKTASTIAGVFLGGQDIFGSLFGNNGFGISSIMSALGVSDTIIGLVAPILGLLGGGGGGCPCDPGCRKTDHFITEKEIELLNENKCETVISNASTSYFPTGKPPDPTKTNDNVLAEAFGFIETQLGKELIPKNILNLTAAILEIPRLSLLGRQTESYQNADWPDFANELSYTMRALEHAIKIADNNMTGVEKVIRTLIDGQFFDDLFERERDNELYETLEETSLAVSELYSMIQKLDQTKFGPSEVNLVPAKSVKKVIKAHASIVKSKKETWAKHLKKIKDFIELALSLWELLEPGGKPEDLKNLYPGSDQNSPIEIPFPMEELEKDLDRFKEDHYKALAELIHTDDASKIQDIFDQISIVKSDEENTPIFERKYQQTLNRLLNNRLNSPEPLVTPNTAVRRLPTPISPPVRDNRFELPSTPEATRREPTPINTNNNRPGRTPSVFNPIRPDVETQPVSSEPRRAPITAEDLQRLAEERGLNDYNTLVKKLLDEQNAAERRKENC